VGEDLSEVSGTDGRALPGGGEGASDDGAEEGKESEVRDVPGVSVQQVLV
jgi:hypothetical protein